MRSNDRSRFLEQQVSIIFNKNPKYQETRRCYYCGMKGHLSRDCLNKKRDERGSASEVKQNHRSKQGLGFNVPSENINN